ncbi:MAG: hypothetical protein H7255_20700, partial [Ramlibacter sp.]|nr:hypothetical protein [Ramlibacter sp.]
MTAHRAYRGPSTFQMTDNPARSGAVTAPASGSIAMNLEQFGPLYQLTLTLNNVPQAVVNGTEYQSTLLYTFPEGRIGV